VRSWLAKIEAVKRLLVDDAPDKKPEVEALAAAYVYLQWIATGAIQCVEGGGHHRPNRHGEGRVTLALYTPCKWPTSSERFWTCGSRPACPGTPAQPSAGMCS
jgi:hypothetical protein